MDIRTPCAKCIFAQWTPGEKEGERNQTGCAAGRLEKYQAQGVTLPVLSEDELEASYEIRRACLHYRDERWPLPENEHPVEAARAELSLKVTALVWVSGESWKKRLSSTLRALKDQHHRPTQVVVLVDLGLPGAEVHEHFREELEGFEVAWRLVRLTLAHPKLANRDWAIEQALASVLGSYMLLMDAGATPPADFLWLLDTAINDDLERWSLAWPAEPAPGQDWTLVQTAMYRRLGGAYPAEDKPEEGVVIDLPSIQAKIQYLADCQSAPYMVHEVEGWNL